MKLAEALSERKRLRDEAARLQSLIALNLFRDEDEDAAIDVDATLFEYNNRLIALEELTARINRTNNTATLADGSTIMEGIAYRDRLSAQKAAYNAFVNGLQRSNIYGYRGRTKDDIKQVPNADVLELGQDLEGISEALRKLDLELQEVNWTADLLD